jgi:hypothetical protein
MELPGRRRNITDVHYAHRRGPDQSQSTSRQSATRKCLNLLQPRCQQRSESRTNPRRRANELAPCAYLRRPFAELPASQTLEQIEALLPWNIKLNS